MQNAIQVAKGNVEEALELLLTGLEPPSTDMFNDRGSANSDCCIESDDSNNDSRITPHEVIPGTKRPRPNADASKFSSNGMNSTLITDHAHGIGHIFVDQSNIGAAEADIPAIDRIISNGLSSCHERVVVGSQTEAVGRGRYELAWKALGYSAHFQQKRANQPESFVDETLVAHIQRALLQHSPEGRIIVLATGELFL